MSRRVKKWGLILVGLLVVYTIVGFFVLPAVLKSQLQSKLPPVIHRTVAIEAIAFNPFTLTLDVKGFRASEPSGEEFASFEELLVNLQTSSLFQRSLNFKEITLRQPSVAFTIFHDGQTNLSNLVSKDTTGIPPPPPTEAAKPLLIHIEKLTLDDGHARFEDQSRPHPYTTLVGPIDFEVTNFKTDPDWSHPYKFTARMDPDTVLSWFGNFSVSPFWSEGTIEVSGVHLKSFEPYYMDRFRGRILDGVAALKLDYRVDTAGGHAALQVQHGEFGLAKLSVAGPDSNDPVLTLPLLAVKEAALDLEKHAVSVGSLSIEDATLSGIRDEQGVLNVQRLLPPPPSGSSDVVPSGPAPDTKNNAGAAPWSIALDQARVANLTLSFLDQVPTQPARFTIDQVNVTFQDIRYPESPPIPADLSLRWNQQGTIKIAGRVEHTPVSADLDATIKDFSLAPFQPYIADTLYVDLTSGQVESTTHLTYGPPGPSGSPVRVRGDLALLRLSTKDSRSADLLAKLDALRLSGLDVQTLPTRISVDQIHLKNFSGQASTAKDGGLNLASLRRPGRTVETPSTEPAKASPGPSSGSIAIAIRHIVIENAGFSMVDRTLEPPLSTGISQLTGRIQNVSYPESAKTTVDLTAKADGRAPIKITGQLQPKGKDSLVDLMMNLKGYDVPAFTAYSRKYVGYPIQKGKLSLDLKYAVANRKLTGETAVLVDQLTLGPKSDSPDATSLPVKLALAILTDRKGQIHLDVPVGGSLDDPEFTLGRVILRALVNILEKVATSPFALLGAVVGGGGEELKDIAFEPGLARLEDPELAKLGKLASALVERPALNLEVSSSVDPREDRTALAKAKLRRLLKQKKLAAVGSKPPAGAVPDDVPLDEVEYERMVRELYASLIAIKGTAQPEKEVTLETLPPPPQPESGFWAFLKRLNPFRKDDATRPSTPTTETTHKATPADGQAPEPGAPPLVPFAEVESAILAKQPVTDDELRQLARSRTEAILNYLIEQGQLGPERVFAATPKQDSSAPPSTHATLALN